MAFIRLCLAFCLVACALASSGSSGSGSSGSGSSGSGSGSPAPPPAPSAPLKSCVGSTTFPNAPSGAKVPVGMSASLYKCIRYNLINGLGLRNFYGEKCDWFATPRCDMSHVIGAIVRLPFHDAAGGSNTATYVNGGANGCIDPKMGGNNGLQDIVAKLNSLYNTMQLGSLSVSKADFWVLTANIAIEFASSMSSSASNEIPSVASIGPLYLPMKMGRSDEANCDNADIPTLPGGDFSYAQTLGVFGPTRMGMSPRQVTAILGAHTVGRASNELTSPGYGTVNGEPVPEAPFRGGWSKFQTSFSNAYYNTLVFKGWKQQVGVSGGIDGNNEWLIDGDSQLMLRADVELMLDTHVAPCPAFNGLPKLVRRDTKCPAQLFAGTQSLDAVKTYAQPTTAAVKAWWVDFTDAWKIMTEFGYITKSNGQLTRKIVTASTSSAAVDAASSGDSSSSSSSGSSNALSPLALVAVFVGLALVVGLSAFILGRKSGAAKASASSESAATAEALQFDGELSLQQQQTTETKL